MDIAKVGENMICRIRWCGREKLNSTMYKVLRYTTLQRYSTERSDQSELCYFGKNEARNGLDLTWWAITSGTKSVAILHLLGIGYFECDITRITVDVDIYYLIFLMNCTSVSSSWSFSNVGGHVSWLFYWASPGSCGLTPRILAESHV